MDNILFDQTWKSMVAENLSMNELVIYEKGEIYEHYFNDFKGKTNIRSISKPITCLCYGIAIENGLFKNGLNELVYDYLIKTQHIYNLANIDKIKKWSIKTLLTLTIGYEMKMMDTKHIATLTDEDYGDVVLNSELKHEAGEFFIYSNAAMYLASIVFENATGYKLVDFANEFIFSKLGIEYTPWKESPQKFAMGCTGIEMKAIDLLKIGILMVNKGVYNNHRIVSNEWIEEIQKPHVLTPMMYDEKRVLPKYAYGLNMWICKDGIYYCDGTDGQYLIVVPQKKMVIVTTGNQKDMKPITRCLEEIIRK